MASMLKLLQPNATCSDLITCMFELNHAESQLYLMLVREGPQKLDALARLAERERSTVYRSLAKLVSLGLASKDSETIPGGGYFHRYSATDPAYLKRTIEARLTEFQQRMGEMVREFEAQIAAAALTAA